MFMSVKIHHSLCDGVSSICTPLACSDDFDRSYFSRAEDAKWWQRLMIRVMMPFQILPFIWMTCFAPDRNALTNKRRISGQSGNINISQAPGLDLEEIKQLAKARGATINDAILAGFLTSLHSIFKEMDEKIPESIHVAIPANIRFKFYASREKVKFENKFTGLAINAPLTPKMDLKAVKTITNRIKGGIGMIYAGYASSRHFFKLAPRSLVRFMLENMSDKTTAFFSNTPGCSKPLKYTNEETGKVTTNIYAQPFIHPAGKAGFALAACSWNGKYYMSLNTDDNVLCRAMNQKLMTRMHELIQTEINSSKKEKKESNVVDSSASTTI